MTRFRVDAGDKVRSLQFFHSESRLYHRRAEHGALLKYMRARERRAVVDLARFHDCAGEIIDVGCGSGVYALAAKAAGLCVTAVDVSPWAVDNVRDKVDKAFVADIESLDRPGGYEIVLCSGVLDYVSQPAAAVRNLCRLVGPSGRLVILVPRVGVGGSVHALIARRTSGLRVNLFTVRWLASEARRWGLELTQARRPLPHNVVAVFHRSPPQAAAAG